MPKVSPNILQWARKTAGMSLEEASKAIGLNAARGQTGAERLALLEAGDIDVPRKLLRRMAEKYRRPLIAFYLAAPPPAGERGEDFRRLPKAAPPEFDPRLDALIRNVRARHDVVRFLLEDDESEPLSFVASAKISDGVDSVSRRITETTGFNLAEYRRSPDIDKAFAYLRDRLEHSGLFVLLLGDLGSHHSKIEFAGLPRLCHCRPYRPIYRHQRQRCAFGLVVHGIARGGARVARPNRVKRSVARGGGRALLQRRGRDDAAPGSRVACDRWRPFTRFRRQCHCDRRICH